MTDRAAGARISVRPDELFQGALFHPLAWPQRSVALRPTTLEDSLGRSATQRLSVGELYHVNSKLHPGHPAIAARSVDSDTATRRDFVRRRCEAAGAEPAAATEHGANVSDRLEAVLAAIRAAALAGDSELLYGLELRLIAQGRLFACEPLSGRLWPIRALSTQDLDALDRAVEPAALRGKPSAAQVIVAVLGAFTRGEILLGSRGYRRTVFDAGRYIAALHAAAKPAPPGRSPSRWSSTTGLSTRSWRPTASSSGRWRSAFWRGEWKPPRSGSHS